MVVMLAWRVLLPCSRMLTAHDREHAVLLETALSTASCTVTRLPSSSSECARQRSKALKHRQDTPVLPLHLVEGYVLNLLVEPQPQLRHVRQQALHHDAANNIVAQHSACAQPTSDHRPARRMSAHVPQHTLPGLPPVCAHAACVSSPGCAGWN